MKVIVRPKKGHLGITIHKPKVSFDGKPIPKGLFSDSDKDGYPNPVDCQPFNKNKQGKVGDWLAAKGEQYREWKAKAPERREAKHKETMQRLKYRKEESAEQAQIQKSRQTIAESRLAVQSKRQTVMAQQQKSMGDMPSMMGGFGSSKSPMQPLSLMTQTPPGFGLTQQQEAKPKTIKRRKPRKKRR